MPVRTLILGAVAALCVAIGGGVAHAQSEGEMIRLHDMCRAGDHEARTRFGHAIHDREHEEGWRHAHPDWYR